jgi:ATP-dependent RNA helicase RhlE
MTQFSELRLLDPLLHAVTAEGYTEPTPIQAQAIPHILAGRDLLGIAQTGTGKTAAFALPILQQLAGRASRGRGPRVLVLAPTRELAAQIAESFLTYGRHLRATCTVIFGGVGQDKQVKELRRVPDVLVATPGRLLDLMQQGHASLAAVEIFVLDEADRMLDMGFIHDVRRIADKVPSDRQTLLFSATMPDEVAELAHRLLKNPIRVEVTPQATTVEKIDQSIYFVEKADKRKLLAHLLLSDPAMRRVLVFTRTKHGANRVVKELGTRGIEAQAIHGNKAQTVRERALASFKKGTTRVLVATDIAARGIDVEDITHVVNYDLPNIAESYVHRIGRTARAGAGGIALAFCDQEEREFLIDIERLIRRHIPRVTGYPHASPNPPPPATALEGRRGSQPAPRPRQGHGQRPPQHASRAPQHHAPRPQAHAPRPAPAANVPSRTPPDGGTQPFVSQHWPSDERRPPTPLPRSRRRSRPFGPKGR